MRMSTSLSPSSTFAPPSCGRRRSAMSISPMISMRASTAPWISCGGADGAVRLPDGDEVVVAGELDGHLLDELRRDRFLDDAIQDRQPQTFAEDAEHLGFGEIAGGGENAVERLVRRLREVDPLLEL